MYKKISLSIFLITALILFSLKYINKIEQNQINIDEIKKSVVIIVPEKELIRYKDNPKWIIEDQKESWIWAWFFINNDWKIQTVNHLVENDNINYKIIYNNKEYNSKVIERNKEKDLAILQIEGNIKLDNHLLISKEMKIWESVFSFWVNIENMKIISNTWTIINKKNNLDNMSNLLEISNNLKPGFSGWPIVNAKWKVVWINYAISEWKNYGIKLPLEFLQ